MGVRHTGLSGEAASGTGRHGAVLLEVILSIGLLLFGMAVIGVQVNSALSIARMVDTDTRAMLLVDTLLAELDAGMITMDANDDVIRGNFLNQAPGFTWRIGIKKSDTDGFYMLTVDIGFNEGQVQAQIDDPLLETKIEDEGVKIIQTVYRLYPKPADVNMERDYGLTQDDMKKLFGGSSSTAGGTGDTGSGDGGTGGQDNQSSQPDLMKMASDLGIDLTQFSFLLDGSSFDPRELSKLPEDQYMQLATLLSAVLSQGGNAIKDFEKQGGKQKLNELAKEKKKAGQNNQSDQGGQGAQGGG
jgi:hypothetical protein